MLWLSRERLTNGYGTQASRRFITLPTQTMFPRCFLRCGGRKTRLDSSWGASVALMYAARFNHVAPQIPIAEIIKAGWSWGADQINAPCAINRAGIAGSVSLTAQSSGVQMRFWRDPAKRAGPTQRRKWGTNFRQRKVVGYIPLM